MQSTALCLAAMLLCASCAHHAGDESPAAVAAPAAAPLLAEPISAPASLTVTSGNFVGGQPLLATHAFHGMGCTGENLSPEIAWQGAPAGTKSFAVIAHDPDAPTGVGFFHWTLFNLPAATTRLPQGAGAKLPPGAVEGMTDFGSSGYGGPCPPPGPAHRYVFTVYAVDVERLPMADAHATGALLRVLLLKHTLAYGRIMGTFQRL